MIYPRWLLVCLALIFTVLPSARAQQWSGILDPSRAVDWSNAGVKGGIPTRTTICATLNPGATTTQINSAIASCPANQVVFLSAGTYGGLTGILFNSKNNVTLRGAGADQTFLIFTSPNSCQGIFADICFQSSDTNWKNGISNGPISWTAGYAKGTTTITLASVPNLFVGNPIILDQTDDAADTGSVFVCSSIGAGCSLQDNTGGAQRLGRNQVQIVTVTSCGTITTLGAACSGTNVAVGVYPALDMPNWSSTKAPQAWWASNPIQAVGIEDMSLDHSASLTTVGTGAGIAFFNALNGWVKGVRSIASSRAHVQSNYSARITVRDSYFFLAVYSTSTSYGFECETGSDNLIENNIFQAVSGPLTINGACSGTVLGYNFDINNFYTGAAGYINAMSNVHTAGTDNILYEGNNGPQIYGDVFHGTHNMVTVFRNYIIGNQPACFAGGSGTNYPNNVIWGPCTNDQLPLNFLSYTRFFNVIGNVLGQSGIHNSYQNIYGLGSGNGLASDPFVAATLMRWGNYDVVTGTRWCGNSSDPGWTTTCGSTSEVPTGLSSYANAVPSTTNLPPSFYLTAKPSWWPAAKPWPPIGPDVTGGNLPNLGGHANTIPAQDCFLNTMHGPADGTGSVLTFNASTCYVNSSSSLPNPPAGLQVAIQ